MWERIFHRATNAAGKTGRKMRSHKKCITRTSSIDMYNNDVGKKSAQKIMKQTGDLKAATLYFAS